jgi:hypothetical protein
MIKCSSKEAPFETDFTNGAYTSKADAPKEKGGGRRRLPPSRAFGGGFSRMY